MSATSWNVNFLRKTEIQYELKIRKLPYVGVVNDLRKALTESLSNNVEVDLETVNSIDVTQELEDCEAKLQNLSELIAEYEGTFHDAEFHRLHTRLAHLALRIERIPVAAGTEVDQEETKNELKTTLQALQDSFKEPEDLVKKTEPAKDSSVGTQMMRSELKLDLSTNRQLPVTDGGRTYVLTPTRNLPSVNHNVNTGNSSSRGPQPKYVPVYKWNLKFDNTGPSIASFRTSRRTSQSPWSHRARTFF